MSPMFKPLCRGGQVQVEHKRNSCRGGRKLRKVLNKIPRRLLAEAVDEKCNSQVDSCPSCQFNAPYTASAGRKRMQLEAY